MGVNSGLFYLISLLAIVAYYLFPKKVRWVILLIFSYVFYFMASGKLIFFLSLSTIAIYLTSYFLDKQDEKIKVDNLDEEEKKVAKLKLKQNKKRILLIGVIVIIGFLIFLKYFNFLGGNINKILNLFSDLEILILNLLLPLGISYYTLQAISYIVDVYRGKYKREKNFFKLALYLSFFPSVSMGPIGRFNELAEPLYEGNKLQAQNIKDGLTLILWGLFKKMVIADRAAILVNTVFGESYGGFTVILGAIFYTIQIYTEFSGSMNIVGGVAKCFGINLPDNFRRPFFAKSIQEFWVRWHITLGTWLKDYVFYPISLSKMNMRVNTFVKKHLPAFLSKFIVVAFPLLFVWLINGIWHGASWKYLAYGMYYYVLMMLALLIKPLTDKFLQIFKINTSHNLFNLGRILRTCLVVVFGMMLFRAASLTEFTSMFKNIFLVKSSDIFDLGLSKFDFIIIIFSIIIIFTISLLAEKKINILEKLSKLNWFIKYLVYFGLILLIVLFGMYGANYNPTDFIYGNF